MSRQDAFLNHRASCQNLNFENYWLPITVSQNLKSKLAWSSPEGTRKFRTLWQLRVDESDGGKMIIEPSRNLETDYAYDVVQTEKEQFTTMLTRAGVLWSEEKFIDKQEPSPPG